MIKDKRDIYIPKSYVVFDLETTGFSPEYAEIIEIGAVRVENGIIKERFQTYVAPRRGIPKQITELTGISSAQTSNAPYIEEAVEDFLDFIGSDILIAHNASFDVRFIGTVCAILGYRFDNDVIDSIKIARAYIDSKSYKLEVLKNMLGIRLRSHNASDDCTVTSKVVEYCRQKQNEKNNTL